MTFLELAKRILEEENKPLSADEIWGLAIEKGYDKNIATTGKTPARTINAQIYVNMRDDPNSPFQKAGTRPRRFFLTGKLTTEKAEELSKKQDEIRIVDKSKLVEGNLHPILSYFISINFKAYAKTINHLKSTKKQFGEWVHPDMVACYFPRGDWDDNVVDFSQAIGNLSIKLYSFEIKIRLDFSNLRESFFQAVSNSSWAHEGYLVAYDILQGDEFRAELQRLSSSFGIGIIQLNLHTPDDSEILYSAKTKDFLDWETINKLAEMNTDFRELLARIRKDLVAQEIRQENYDKILSPEKILEYISKLNI